MPWLPALHTESETREWIGHVVATQHVVVAERAAGSVGYLALEGRCVEQVYVDPAAQGAGVGTLLLDAAKRASPAGLHLHVFTRNEPARRFYEKAEFVLVRQGDGSGNEEREPDCTYCWTPTASGSSS